MKQHSFASRLKSLALVFGIALAFASCANEDIAQNQDNKDNDASLTTFSTGDPTTRTSMESDGKFFWEAGDKIYVKDDNGTWNASSNSPTGKTAYFRFKVPGTYTAHMSYEVYYPGKNGNQNQVTIAANQSQAEPNSTAHFGASGDCGMATATRIASERDFNFTLDHKAAYLLFLPRIATTVLYDCYITKVEVNSDNDITDTYTLDQTTGELTGTGTGKQITVSTGGSGTYANGFPLTNSTTSAATNGTYVVIKPGTHTLKIRYWVKDVATGTEGIITKTLSSATYDQNKYYNITANLDVRSYDGDHYYMWDAQEQFWKGYEWTKNLAAGVGQPTLESQSANNYPQSDTDPRYYNKAFTYGADTKATHTSCKDLPNANEMSWYCMYGDPHWDADELWTTMGHLYKGGIWFKKKSVLQAEHHYDTEKSADGTTDMRTTNPGYGYYRNSSNSGIPSAADAGNYFYLPALGSYSYGRPNNVGYIGYYWSSSADPQNRRSAYYLYLSINDVGVYSTDRYSGMRVEPTFEQSVRLPSTGVAF